VEPPAEVAAATPEHNVQLDLGLAVVGLAYERAVASRLAIQLEGHVFGTWFGPIFDEPNLIGFGAGLRPTVFLTGDAPRGVYIAPFVRVDRVTIDEPGATKNWGYSTGAFVGYSWLFGAHFNARVGAGAQWFAYEVFVGDRRESFTAFLPALDLVVGYAF
jgi:hypothetical protein